ncbi:hypothetical protein OIDMADRAFT_100107 [Oidiodendron maius Zn]|uniref:Major facilitator superfamily (MFS) profile domain-containing protein n=1 Tax=Oidiodendron maius (strain Zn) TaxID=913774 RepID=A0A0C3HZH7_OIDMZ|nr:hypothetical protein OIDMADRAFT_100107 [Oidiodendron maius Zn]
MAFNEDPEKVPVPDPSTGTEHTDSLDDDDKTAIPAPDDDGALDKEVTVEPIHPAHERDLEKQDASGHSKLSRIATALTARSKKERLARTKIPESDLDNGIVGWEGQDDPEMPLNFAASRKWMLLGLLSSITFVSPLASSMFAPAVSFADETFHNTSVILSTLSVTIFLLGYTIGPLILAPLSEIYGRRFVLTGGNVFFTLFQIGCALSPNMTALIVLRFFSGIGGSGCLTIGGGVIADLFPPDQRGLATSLYSLGPLFGPIIGPICGGFVAQRASWRWVFWILLIAAGSVSVGIELLNRETNHRVLMKRKVQRLQKELNRPELRSCYDTTGSPESTVTILINGILRPLKMLFLSPIITLLSLYMAFVYGLLYLLFTTIPTVFIGTYHWDPEITGLAYIGLGVGFMTALVVVAKISDMTVVRMTKANNGVFEPEMRLPACIIFACFIPITFFWYGWSADKKTHWIVPVIGLMPFGFGMMGIFIPIQTYVIDAFLQYAASGVAALTVSRSLFGTFLPLAGPKMYAALGLGWGNSVLGFIALALIPAPMFIFKFGARMRKNYPVNL